MEYGCGQCMPCRINKQREWVARLQLELLTAPFSCFVTLTYAGEEGPARQWLQKEHAQLWIKRLREFVQPRRIRYFLVGEYGEENQRAHYHAILYGVHLAESAVIEKSWPFGHVLVGTAEQASLSYVCGYVTKKMTKKDHRDLGGRPPEFALMSKKPGIGKDAVRNLAAAYRTEAGQAAMKRDGYVSRTVRIGPKVFPLGRYLTGHLAEQMGLTPEDKKKANYQVMLKIAAEKMPITTTAYERKRRAQVDQQEGQIQFRRKTWKRKL